MSEGWLLDRRLPLGIVLAGILALGAIAFTPSAGTGSGSAQPVLFNGVTRSNLAAQARPATINFTKATVTTTIGDLLVVVAQAFNGTTFNPGNGPSVLSVTDTTGNTYTQRVKQQCNGCFQGMDSEIWTTTTFATSLIITVKWNTPIIGLFFVGDYANALGVGSSNSTLNTNSGIVPNTNTNVTMVGNVSAVIDSVFQDDVNGGICADGLPAPGLAVWNDTRIKERTSMCGTGFTSISFTGLAEIADTAPSSSSQFQHATTLKSNEFNSGIGATDTTVVSLEITPGPSDQSNECTKTKPCPIVDPDPFCATTGDTCHVNFATKASGSQSTQALTAGTTYCTGITTGQLTTTITSAITIQGDYSLESRNVTGQFFTVQFVISSTAPSAVFGSGACAGSTSATSVNLYAAVISTTGKGFSISASLTTPSLVAGNYWGSINIRPITTNVSIDNLGTTGTATVPGSSLAVFQSA